MDWVHLNVEYIHKETDSAFLVSLDDWEGEFWLPKSLCSDPDDYHARDRNCTISIQAWKAQELGIDPDDT